MRYWSIASITCILIAQYNFFRIVNASDDDSKLRSPQCVHDLNKHQVEALQHFNGIFGSFTATSAKTNNNEHESAIYGPLAAINITSSNYGINMVAQKTNCNSNNPYLKYALISNHAKVDEGDIYGDVWTKHGSVQNNNKNPNGRCFATVAPFRILEPKKDYIEAIWSFAPTAIKNTSKRLAELHPDTVITTAEKRITPLRNRRRSFEGYRVLKLPACSDRACAVTADDETSPDVLKGGATWSGNYKGALSSDEMLVFNIPVFAGSTFTISTLDVTKNISPCQIVYNFYPVNQLGDRLEDPQAYFTLVRSPDVTIKGTILAPQARIIDSVTGYFGGQLITLQSYEGKGASIRDFSSISGGECSSRSLCWPQGPKVVVEVVTVSDVTTHTSTVVHATSTQKDAKSVQTKTVIQQPAATIMRKYVNEEFAELKRMLAGMPGLNGDDLLGSSGNVLGKQKSHGKKSNERVKDNVYLRVVTEQAKETMINTEYTTAVSTSTIIDVVSQIRNNTS